MSESVRWALALTYLGSLFSMAAFLIYKRVPGWGWFLAVVCVVVPAPPSTSTRSGDATMTTSKEAQ